ncbi:MAG TPA: glycosyltransferase, partial [Bryobacteraceae bacterium]|nr:glycosyltransferase [Bryobacteraceae bacterium]
MKKLDFVFFDAGGGHRSAALALKAVIEQQGRPWKVRLVNLQEVLSSLDIFRKYLGIRMEDVYNRLLAKGWTLGSELLVPPMQTLIRIYHPAERKLLSEFWRRDPPDMVVSVIPNFGKAIYQGLRRVSPDIPLVTIITDFADYPPHFWMEPGFDQLYVCGTDRAMDQARSIGYTDEQLFRASGMIIRPSFYEQQPKDRRAERVKLGLKPDALTGCVLFGGQGSYVMLDIARRLADTDVDTQLIFICGKNATLAEKLRVLPRRIPFHVVGFTHEVPYYMAMSDYFIGKPGPGSISEAIAMKLPVIIERNAWTLPQERYNADWVRDKDVGIVLGNLRE